ncbi:hypothetical protein [Sulfitobacter sp. R86518]|uniref:hypothetical protein n=1 Tax=Sulfitobacter sp. R86518 TaxID=3093858 RepID=UPI0036DEF532
MIEITVNPARCTCTCYWTIPRDEAKAACSPRSDQFPQVAKSAALQVEDMRIMRHANEHLGLSFAQTAAEKPDEFGWL